MTNILIVAGELSGDMHGARLVRSLKAQQPDLHITAMGGENLAAAGAEILVNARDMGVVGAIEVIKVLPTIWRAYLRLKKFIRETHPKLVILIDYPGFNIRLAKLAKLSGCKVLYYISPQLWAWHQSRVNKLKRYVDMMAVIFPFEVAFYKKFQMPAKFVGHPLTIEPLSKLTTEEAKKQLKLNPNEKVIALLPGSRNGEIQAVLQTLLNTAEKLHKANPNYQFVLPKASNIDKSSLTEKLQACSAPILITETDRYTTMQACDLAIASSGTVTLELALLHKPMIIVYKGNPITFWLGKRVAKVDYLGLPNIIANQSIVPELLQDDATDESISKIAENLLNDSTTYQKMQTALIEIKQQLQGNNEKTSLIELVNDLVRED